MKTRFTNQQLPHVWLYEYDKYDPDQRVSGSNMFFEGDMIFSYGRHFPLAWCPLPSMNLVIINGSDSSVTTAKHKHHVRAAIPMHFARVVVPDLGHERSLISVMRDLKASASEALRYADHTNERQAYRQFDNYLGEYHKWMGSARVLLYMITPSKSGLEGHQLETFKKLRNELLHATHDLNMRRVIKNYGERRAYVDARIESTRRRADPTPKSNSDLIERLVKTGHAFMNHQRKLVAHCGHNVSHLLRYESEGDLLRTSHGLVLDAGTVRQAWPTILAGMINYVNNRDTIPFMMDMYHCSFSNGAFVVGCHRFPLQNILDVADDMQLGFSGSWHDLYCDPKTQNKLYSAIINNEVPSDD